MKSPRLAIAALIVSGTVLLSAPLAIKAPDPNQLIEQACGGLPGFVVDGNVYCTHGPDPEPEGLDQFAPVAPASPRASTAVCDGDGVSGKRYQVIYVHDGDNRYDRYLQSFRQWSEDASNIFDASARQQGSSRHVRYVTDPNCNVIVDNVELASSDLQSFSATISALKAKGYNRADRKYLIFADATVYCGIGTVLGDSIKSRNNRNNSGPSYSRVDSGCWGGFTAAHEIAHNLGAVQQNAPNKTAGWHCTDESDVMCYKDGPENMRQVCPSSQENIFDCNKDDYFSISPEKDSYLASHWSISDSDFLVGQIEPTRVPTQAPTPSPAPTQTPVSSQASLKIDPASVKAGARVRFSLSGFRPGTTVTLTMQGSPLQRVIMDSSGKATGTLRINRRAEPGFYILVATGSHRATAQITVTR